MAYRVFSSPDGATWQAWDVPGDDRPLLPGAAPRSEALRLGWVCFESGDEKRRLTPIPPRWAERSDDELWLFCRVAERVAAEHPARGAAAELENPPLES
jgi:hypothetical protein